MTIGVAVRYKSGIVLGADRLVSVIGRHPPEGMQPETNKIYKISKNVACIGAGYEPSITLKVDFISRLYNTGLSDLRKLINVLTYPAALIVNPLDQLRWVAPASLLLAGYDNDSNWRILKLNNNNMKKCSSGWGVIGKGRSYAEAVIRKNYRGDLSVKEMGELVRKAVYSAFVAPGVGKGCDVVRLLVSDQNKKL